MRFWTPREARAEGQCPAQCVCVPECWADTDRGLVWDSMLHFHSEHLSNKK